MFYHTAPHNYPCSACMHRCQRILPVPECREHTQDDAFGFIGASWHEGNDVHGERM